MAEHAVDQSAAEEAELVELKQLHGPALGKAYAYSEVADHMTVNSALETTLIPSASNPELEGLLETGLNIFQGRQMHAERVAASLK